MKEGKHMSRKFFADVCPELVKEWSDKNLPLIPEQVTFGSHKVVWWKADCGHEWLTSVKSRANGEGCPYCAGKRVLVGFNDLATLMPQLAEEWSDKNEISPQEVTIGSVKKVWWKGKCGHEWKAIIKNRARGSKCPYCSNRLLLKDFNDLQYLHPELAVEWSKRNLPLKPDMVMEFSNKKVWWQCKTCGHEWKAAISSRSLGSKCAYCSGRILTIGMNDFQTTHPELAKEWSEKNKNIEPTMIKANSREVVWWKCSKCNKDWRSSIVKRVRGKNCPLCEREKRKEEEIFRYQFQKDMKKFEANIRTEIIRYYAKQYEVKVLFDAEEVIGTPIDMYLPEIKGAIILSKPFHESFYGYRMEQAKNELCKKSGIRLIRIVEHGFKEYDDCFSIACMDDSLEAFDQSVMKAFEVFGIKMDIDTERDMRKIFVHYQNYLEMNEN